MQKRTLSNKVFLTYFVKKFIIFYFKEKNKIEKLQNTCIYLQYRIFVLQSKLPAKRLVFLVV